MDLSTFGFLFMATGFALMGQRSAAWAAYAAALVVGLVSGVLEWTALPSVAAFAGCLVGVRRVGFVCGAIALVLAVALSNHGLPGFHNWPVFRDTRFAADSLPFTMFLNFDKTSVGLLLCLLWLPRSRKPALRVTAWTTLALVGLMLPLAYAASYVRFDPKWPELAWLWMLNNFFFVCLAEEGLFRGFIQGGLRRRLPAWGAIAVAAALFGLAHWRGGPVYVALAAVAGLFYGYVYERTGRLEAAMSVHFGLNLTHFLLFSYPALQR